MATFWWKNEYSSYSITYATPLFTTYICLWLYSRWIAAKQATEKKIRIVLDYSELNRSLKGNWYPIKYCESFRQEVARNFSVSSSMVLYKYYFQIPVQKEAIRRLTGFIAFNTLWTWLRLSQDIHTAPGIAQFVIDWLFERCKTFRWIYGWCLNIQQSVDEHLNTDLPWCFAALSAYQCLLSPKKCEWLANSMRVLGHQIGVDYVDLPEPRTEEIRTLKFQNTKEALLSKLCFMSYFMHVNPKIFQHLASLRELTKRGGHYKPTPLHEKQFEDVKEVQLDPVWKTIRTPSLDVNYEYFVIPDSSRSVVAGMLWQTQRPLSGYLKNCKFIRDKELYIDGCYSKTLSSTFHFYGSWYKEFQALQDIVRKFENLLRGRNFWIMSNNSIVTWWVSMTKVSDEITRKISYLNSFNWKIVYICLKLNPTNTFTRNNPQFEDKKACRTL